MKVGEKRTLESVVGDAWWEPEGLAGIPVRCDVSLKELFEWDVPEVSSPLGQIPVCLASSFSADPLGATFIKPCDVTCSMTGMDSSCE